MFCAEIEDEGPEQSFFRWLREFRGATGVGRKLHEEPQIPNYGKPGSGPKLKAGMTLAIEPMINLGWLRCASWRMGGRCARPTAWPRRTSSTRFLITKDEPEILTWRARTQLK